MSRVRIVRDEDPTETADDFLRVSCEGDQATGVFTTIERVLGGACGSESTGTWRLRRLFDGMLGSEDDAVDLAKALAEHKGIPLVYADSKKR